MEPADWISLVAILVGPMAALGGVWVSHIFAQRSKAMDRADRAQDAALDGLARMFSLLVDANPMLVLRGDHREFAKPADALADLYLRWASAREPLILLSLTHPDDEVRRLAARLPERVELTLRFMDDELKAGYDSEKVDGLNSYSAFSAAGKVAFALGSLLSPTGGQRSFGA